MLELAFSYAVSAKRYFTRVKKSRLLERVLGLEYSDSDLQTIRGLEEKLMTMFS